MMTGIAEAPPKPEPTVPAGSEESRPSLLPTSLQQISTPKLLIGEGREEVRFFGALLAYLKISDVRDVCLAAIQTYPDIQCINEYLRCIREKTSREPGNLAKARVHAWLASQTEPDRRLGEAAEIGYWPWESPAFDQLKSFLRAM